eukprot:1811850-Heterocapsa_arctica.AAC.1
MTLARGYALNLAASITGACPAARGVASSLLPLPFPPPRCCACLGALGVPLLLPAVSAGRPRASRNAARK